MNNSKPISSGHSKSPNPNQPQLQERIPPLSQAVFYPNVPNSKKNGWRVRNASEEMLKIVTHPEGRPRRHPPPTPKTTILMMTYKGPQQRGRTWPHHDRKGPS